MPKPRPQHRRSQSAWLIAGFVLLGNLRYRHGVHIALAVALLATLMTATLGGRQAEAAGGYNANAVLGQAASTTLGSFTSSVPNGQAAMNNPQATAFNPVTKTLFVADDNNNRVLVYRTNPTTNEVEPSPSAVLGQSDFNGVGFGNGPAEMYWPVGVAVDTDRNYLFVSEYANNRVTVFDVNTITNGQSAINILGKSSWYDSNANSGAAGLAAPHQLDYDPVLKYLFVADNSNNRVMVWDVASITNGKNAVAVLGQPDTTTYSYATTRAKMSDPVSVAVNSSSRRLAVADRSNNRVLVFDITSVSTGANASRVLGQSDYTSSSPGTSATALRQPIGVGWDTTRNRLLIADESHRVVVHSASSLANNQSASFVLGQTGFSATASDTNQNGFSLPRSMSYDPGGDNFYIPDAANNRVLVFGGNVTGNNPNATASLPNLASDLTWDYSRADTNDRISAWGVNSPFGVALDSTNHRLFVAETSNNRVLVHNLDSNNRMIDLVADAVLGQSSFTTRASGLTRSTMNEPHGLGYRESTNHLFVADRMNRRVLVFDVASITNGEDAAYVIGKSNFTTATSQTSQSGTAQTAGVAVDDVNGRLFIADNSNNRVLVFNIADGITNGESATAVLGQSGYSTANAGNGANQMQLPWDAEWDPTSNYLYVGETSNNRVMVFDVATIVNGESAVNVLGQAGWGTSTSGSGPAGFALAPGLAIDVAGRRLFVVDQNNYRVLVFDITTVTDGESAVRVFGQGDLNSAVTTLGRDGLGRPSQIAYDPTSSSLFVVSLLHNRVVQLDVDTYITTTSLVNGARGSAYSQQLNATNPNGTTSYSVTGGALPGGLTLSSSGAITGTPTASGTFNFTVRASTSPSGHGTLTGSRAMSITVPNQNPNPATSLAQTKTDGTALATGAWTNESSVRFTANVSDQDPTDSVALCIEAKPVSTPFVNTENSCGTGVAYSGSAVQATHVLSGLSNATAYHWQARTRDAAGAYSSWSSYGGNSDVVTAATDFAVDTSAPNTGSVRDGASQGVDVNFNSGSLSSLSGNWSGFSDSGSGLSDYEYSIGTSVGGTEIAGWTVTTATEVTRTGLTLRSGQRYFFNVRARDAVGNVSGAVSSNGQSVAPSLSFTVSSNQLAFDNLNVGNSYTSTRTLDVTTSTNAYGGYVVRQFTNGLLSSGPASIPAYNGTYADPTTWAGSGFGYTSNDTSIQASGNLFGSATRYSRLSTSAPGDIVADHTANVSGTPITGQSFTLTYRISAADQAAGRYSGNVALGATAIY